MSAPRRGRSSRPDLRAVGPDDVAATRKPLTVEEAAASGSRRDLLVAMRTRIAQTVADASCPPRDLAALSRRLQDIADQIEQIDLRAKQEAQEDGSATADEEWDEEAL